MVEKITSLVLGLLALALEVWLSIVNPTVESIVAAAFALVIVICAIVSLRRRVVIEESAPKNGKRPVDKVLKLSDQIAPYIKDKNGEITLTIEK